MENSFFQSQMDEWNSLEEIRNWEHPPWYGNTRFEEKVEGIFLENQQGLHLYHFKTHFRMPVHVRKLHIPPSRWTQSQTLLAERNHSLFHWNTLTSPELRERIWVLNKNAASTTVGTSMGQGILSDSWTGFTQFTLLDEKPPDGHMWSGERLTKRQATSRPDHLWPELWTKLGRNAKLREKQKWSIEKPKLDNARRLRGIYFKDPEDKEFKVTIRNARKKLETPMAPAMPCKTCKKSKKGETRRKTNDFKSKLACILKVKTILQERGDNSLQHYNLVHKFIPMPQAMKIPAAKTAVDKEWEKLEKIPAGVGPDKSQK